MLNSSIMIEGSAEKFPDHIAIIMGEQRITYRELDQTINRMANGLRQAGVVKGTHVMLACPNIPAFVISFYAIIRAGGAVVPISILSKKNEIIYELEDTEAIGFICFENFGQVRLADEGYAAFNSVFSCKNFWMITSNPSTPSPFDDVPTLTDLMSHQPDQYEYARTNADDTAEILYTAGVSGRPLGAELTHQNLLSAAFTAAELTACTEKDNHLVVLPLFHCFAQSMQMNSCLLTGGTLVLIPRFSPKAVLNAMENGLATLFVAVPEIYKSLVNHRNLEKFNLKKISKHLRACMSGGGPLPVELYHAMMKTFNIKMFEGYGLSETAAMATGNKFWEEVKPGSVGRAVWGMHVRVVDADMQDVPLGKSGEIVIRGHATMKGYYNRPQATAYAFRGGWLHTNDIAHIDKDGYIFIEGRITDMIIRGGFNVYPQEIERVLMMHPSIDKAAVVGVPSERYGEEVKAFVTLTEGCEFAAKDIIAWAKSQIAGHKYPRLVIIREDMPLDDRGQIIKSAL